MRQAFEDLEHLISDCRISLAEVDHNNKLVWHPTWGLRLGDTNGIEYIPWREMPLARLAEFVLLVHKMKVSHKVKVGKYSARLLETTTETTLKKHEIDRQQEEEAKPEVLTAPPPEEPVASKSEPMLAGHLKKHGGDDD